MRDFARLVYNNLWLAAGLIILAAGFTLILERATGNNRAWVVSIANMLTCVGFILLCAQRYRVVAHNRRGVFGIIQRVLLVALGLLLVVLIVQMLRDMFTSISLTTDLFGLLPP